jgi:pimeloyl-ACP methyl ester carboxylesterase
VPEHRIVLVGARDLDPPEVTYLDQAPIRRQQVADLAVADLPDGPLYVHVDLDVIDAAQLPGLRYPAPGGPDAGQVADALGLGRPPRRIGMMGISMGGYGALLLAEKYPHLIAAAAAISPAIWTSYAQATAANPDAYASAAAFAAHDAVTHAPALAHVPVRVAAGYDDPFYPGVQALARVLPAGAVVDLGRGCHTGPFFAAQQPPSLAFLARHLAS